MTIDTSLVSLAITCKKRALDADIICAGMLFDGDAILRVGHFKFFLGDGTIISENNEWKCAIHSGLETDNAILVHRTLVLEAGHIQRPWFTGIGGRAYPEALVHW